MRFLVAAGRLVYRGGMKGSHENLVREDDLKPGSERGFGIVMAVAFLIFAGLSAWAGHPSRAGILAAIAAGFALLAYTAPAVLAPLNRLWFRFGLLLHKIMSPLILGLLFFTVITPIGLLMRLFGKRPLPLGLDREAATYWTPRAVPAPAPGSMRKQF
jgi:hypothetical protein